jgi:hypothetical protein
MLSVSFHAYSHDYYYWYQGKQIPLRQGSQLYIIYDAKESKSIDSLQVIEGGYLSSFEEAQLKWGIVSKQTLANAKNVLYQVPSFVSSDTTQDMFVTHRFYVKLRQQNDTILLHNFAEQHQAVIEQEGDFPLWYIIRCGLNSQQNALSLANIFYESGLFEVAEPEFINTIHVDCVNDPMFSQQWNLKNTGQWFESYSGIDINYCAAHAITKGDSSVIIGVYDLGVDLTHPDINLYSFSYDVNTQSSPSTIYTTADGRNYHGTACAGIIGAKTDNSIGVAGIAPDCPIMSISFHNTTTRKIGDAFKVAANQGCSVISNSWHFDTPCNYINEGISYALSHGRNGKGCVIVFSAGNENRDSINYPANSNDSIIVVGAISPCGERCNPYSCDGETNWGSNYGNKLDIMAPGVLIRTTDNVGISGANSTDYMTNFNATSSACPHVAAVAGLVLSVNPCLTQKEVADIIESTAQKISIGFGNDPNRPNGTWSNYFGYGLVDAYAAVQKAADMNLKGPDILQDSAWYYIANLPANTSVTWSITNELGTLKQYTIVSQTTDGDSVYIANRQNNGSNPPPIFPGLLNGGADEINAGLYHKGYITATLSNGATSYALHKTIREPNPQPWNPSFSFALSGNVNHSQINITISKNDSQQQEQIVLDGNKEYTLELWHSIYGKMMTQQVHDTQEQMNITGIPMGMCIIVLKEDGNTIAETKVLLK